MTDSYNPVSTKTSLLLESSCRYGTPQYILHEDELVKNCQDFKESFEKRLPRCRFYYPYKTNSLPHLLKIIHSQGYGAEVSSKLELELSKKIGVKDTVFNSPGKTYEEIKYAINEESVIIIDNLDELDRIINASIETGQIPKLGVRLNPLGTSAGEWSRFGVAEKEIPILLQRLEKQEFKLSGLHFHIGSSIYDVKKYESAIKSLKQIMIQRFGDILQSLQFIDIGGGFAGSET